MGPNEKALREIVSGIILNCMAVIVVFSFLFAMSMIFLEGAIFCRRHFFPPDIVVNRCIEVCKNHGGVWRDTPKVLEPYTHYCECTDKYTIWMTRYYAHWEELFDPNADLRDLWNRQWRIK